MANVILINPAEYKNKYTSSPSLNKMVFPPLGLGYIAAVLEQNVHKVNIIDSQAVRYTIKEFHEEIRKKKPDIVGIQAFTPSIGRAIITADLVKEMLPDIKVILGGHHPTFMPEKTLEMSSNVDYLLRGEADYTFSLLANIIENGNGKSRDKLNDIEGLSYREKGKNIHNFGYPLIKDIDLLPFPARHLFPLDKYHYFGAKREMQTMISSRGCPYKCRFCAVGAFHRHKWRPRSAENVVDEMEHIREEFGIKAIAVMDDMATFNKNRIKHICREIMKRDLDIYWGTVSRVDTVDREILSLMARSRCLQVMVGVESGNQQILDNAKKAIKVEQIKGFFRWCKELGMDTVASIAFGLPGETRDTLSETLNLMIKLNPGVAVFSAATPYPGTPFWDEARENKWLPNDIDWANLNMYDPVLSMSELTKEELEDFITNAYKKFRRRPKWGFQRLFHDIRYSLKVHGLLGLMRNPPLTIRLFKQWLKEKSMSYTFEKPI